MPPLLAYITLHSLHLAVPDNKKSVPFSIVAFAYVEAAAIHTAGEN